MKTLALIALLAGCPWQPSPAPEILILPDAAFERTAHAYALQASGKRVSLADIALAQPAPMHYQGFAVLSLNMMILRESTVSPGVACHEAGHLVNGPGHAWMQ